MENFGTRIEWILTQRNIKPSTFYKEIGIASQNYYDWKTKGATPNAMTALKIARYLGVSVEFLLTGESNNPLIPVVEGLQKKYYNLKKSMIEVIENA